MTPHARQVLSRDWHKRDVVKQDQYLIYDPPYITHDGQPAALIAQQQQHNSFMKMSQNKMV